MKRLFALCAILAVSQNAAFAATELLTNPGLDLLDSDGNPNPALYYDKPVGWDIETDPCSYSPCAIARYPGYPADFADRLVAGGNGIVFNSTEGNYPGYEFEGYDAVDAILTQSVPAVAGQKYRMTGHAYFETGYAGGVEIIDPDSPTTHAGLPSVTDTFFALDFLDMNGDPLLGSVEYELHDDLGQQNEPNEDDGRKWYKHTLIGVAPLGTVSVQVRAAMIDGEFNIDPPDQHQAAWVDDFSLQAIPEPASWLLGMLGVALVGAVRRTR